MNLASVTTFFAHIPTDWIILFVFAVVVSLDAVRSGASRARALALSAPIAYVLYQGIATSAYVGPLIKNITLPLGQSALALGCMLLVFLLVLKLTTVWGDDSGKPASSLLSGVAATVIFLVIWLQIAPLDTLWHFGSIVQSIFGTAYRMWWLLGSYLVLAFVRN